MAERPYEDVQIETHPLLPKKSDASDDRSRLQTFSKDDLNKSKDPLTRVRNDGSKTKNNPKLHLLDTPPERVPRYGAAQSSTRLINDFSRYTTSVFTSEVHKESSYRREVQEKMRCGDLLRRFTAIPFSLYYGIALYFMLRCIFLNVQTEREYASATRSNRNASKGLSSSQLKIIAKVDIEWGDTRLEFIGVCAAYTLVLAFMSIFSRSFRCLLLLIIPSFVTGRSRTAMFTFITGLLFNRPISGIAYSLNLIFEKSFKTKPIPSIISENLFVVGISLISISMLILFVEAITYMRAYYSDNDYDNKNINSKTRALWKRKQLPDLLPLRRWEVNKGYETSISYSRKFNFSEFLRSSSTSLLFTLVAGAIVFADYQLQRMARTMMNEDSTGTIEISVTKYIVIGVFLAIALASRVIEHLLCVGLRSRMCDAVYTERVLERADYLHFRISTGRVQRRTHLTLTILNNLEKKRRSRKMVAPMQKMKTCLWRVFCCGCLKRTIVCPGCEWNVMKSDSISIKFTVGNINVKESICRDCHQDFRDLSSLDHQEEYFSESVEVQNAKEHYFNQDIVEFWDDVYNSSL